MSIAIPSYFQYWGKAKPQAAEGPRYHLLAYHSLDVAAVGWCLLDPTKNGCQRMAKQLGVNPQWLQQFFCFCLMLHDLGKFARAFQNLAPDLSNNLVPSVKGRVYSVRHDSLGFVLWRKCLSKVINDIFVDGSKLEPWLEMVCGHHGQPPRRSVPGLHTFFMAADEAAAEAFIRELVKHWLPDTRPLQQIDKKSLRAVSWQLAGVAVLADWLGSDQEVFNYCTEPQSLEGYWQHCAQPNASKALAKAGLSVLPMNTFTDIKQQFPFIQQATPLQRYASTVPLVSGSQLFLLEDVTGAGKTEAAMVLCHRLMSQGQASGLYVALPTMATANSMYERLVNSYRALFDESCMPSLVLAHGARQLSEGFVSSVVLANQMADSNYDKTDASATAYCNAWLADSRKKALLADIGVGTIDQALLAVLPARHQSLRLLGLSDKILLVDEVHAYDPYMRSLLSTLLEAHARQGGSAILLSATLPQNLRSSLLAGFAKGLSQDTPSLGETAYPLVTQFSASGICEEPVATRDSVRRKVAVARLDSEGQAIEQIQLAVAAGRCVCWIRNTVKDARSVYEQLQSQPWMADASLVLFHSRFAMVDRQRIEQDVLARFGKQSKGLQRRGQVLIATQVVEQSLDLDFDEMISDLAPVDLLIQRAGRLQRHNRNHEGTLDEQAKDPRPSACLSLLGPDPDNVASDNWLKRLLPGTQAVYANVGQLWLSLNVLLEKQGFVMPDDARYLIESVYSDAAQQKIPDALQLTSMLAMGVQKGERSMAALNHLKLEKGYTIGSGENSGGWDEDVRIPTRLGAESISVVLVCDVDGELLPYAGSGQHGWALSQLSIPEHEWRSVSQDISPHWKKVIENLKEQVPALRWLEILPLTEDLADCYSPAAGWTWNIAG